MFTDRPDPPLGKPKVSDITSATVRLSWQPPSHDGGTIITSYSVEKSEGKTGVWLHCSLSHMTHMTIRHLHDNKEYKFRVIAENAQGVSDPGEETDVIITQDPKIDIDYDKLGEMVYR